MEKTTHDARQAFEQFLFCGGAPDAFDLRDAPSLSLFGGYAGSYAPPIAMHAEGSARASSEIVPALLSLARKMVGTVVLPLLRAQTREDFFKILASRWNEFRSALEATRTLLANASSEEVARALAEREAEANVGDLTTIAEKLGGPDAAEEVRFVTQTYRSALRIVDRFGSEERLTEDVAKHDRSLCAQFSTSASVHQLGGFLLLTASVERPTNVGIDGAFELLRWGAVDAYAAAREAYQLRHPPQQFTEFLPFDDDDLALADADVEPRRV